MTADPQIGPQVAPAVFTQVVMPVVISVVGQAGGAGVRLKQLLSKVAGYAQGPALVQSQAVGGVTVEAMQAHGFVARGWPAPDALTPQFLLQGDVSVAVQAILSFTVDRHIATPPVAPPVPAAAPPVPLFEPPVPVLEPPVPVVEPPEPLLVMPPVPVDEPPVPLVVEPPVPLLEPPVPLPPVPSLTVSPLVQPYPMRPSATIALNPATTNEVRFI